MFPALVLLVLAAFASALWLAHTAATPPHSTYLMTPERLEQISRTKVRMSEETWQNNGVTARGWLARGTTNAPAVILLHSYGADRSWLLNLGVRMNEATGFTVLIPDLRGHGENAAISQTSFGGCEAGDIIAAIRFLRDLKTVNADAALVGKPVGLYGVELGAMTALLAAAGSEDVRALALDSVPASSDELIRAITAARSALPVVTKPLADGGSRIYLNRCYNNIALCQVAQTLGDRRVLLLAGKNDQWHSSTVGLAECFGKTAELRGDLQQTGHSIINNATGAQEDAYNREIIRFFQTALKSAAGSVAE